MIDLFRSSGEPGIRLERQPVSINPDGPDHENMDHAGRAIGAHVLSLGRTDPSLIDGSVILLVGGDETQDLVGAIRDDEERTREAAEAVRELIGKSSIRGFISSLPLIKRFTASRDTGGDDIGFPQALRILAAGLAADGTDLRMLGSHIDYILSEADISEE